ncbi:MAG: DUF3006 domain-containing protein [Anaerolineae bacterium]
MSDLNASNLSAHAGRRGVIDQIEDELVTIVFDDNNESVVVARQTLPPNSRVGDVVTIGKTSTAFSAQAAGEAAPSPTIEVDDAETQAAKERVRNLIDDIFKKHN